MIEARDKQTDNTFGDKIDVPRGLQLPQFGFCFYDLAPDEALRVDCDVPDARYWSLQLYRMRVVQPVRHRPDHEPQPHADARSAPTAASSVVVAHDDPGVPNWLDTEGRAQGLVNLRYFWGTRLRPSRRRGRARRRRPRRPPRRHAARRRRDQRRDASGPAATTSPGGSAPDREPATPKLTGRQIPPRLSARWTSTSPPSSSPSATRSRRSSTPTTTPSVFDVTRENMAQIVDTPERRAFMAQDRRAGLARHHLAQGVGRPGGRRRLRVPAQRGARRARRPADRQGRRHHRQDDPAPRQREAEEGVPAEDPRATRSTSRSATASPTPAPTRRR